MGPKSIKMLCIEDDAEMLELFRLIFTRRGYDVQCAESGREGLDLVRSEKPDLILLDLMMPEMDGWEVYQQLKSSEQTRSIPVVVVTAKAQNIDKVLGLHVAHVDDYITKPFSPNELVERVENVLNRVNG
jgi:DNA-binding response OmpR family regulator